MAALALGACTAGPMSTLDPAGPGAAPITRVWWAMFWGSVLVILLMTFLGTYAALRRPRRPSTLSPLVFIAGGGVAFPMATMLVLLLWGIRSGHALLPLPTEQPVFRVDVIAHQWWWEVVYPDAPGGPLYSANEIYAPVGRPIDVRVRGADVIHSFWVPRLGGKIDAIPGHDNAIRLQADAAGIYRGQCAEYCGAQHARMAILLEALSEDRLRDRLGGLADARTVDSSTEGASAFEENCARCHSTDPRARSEVPGPNLAGFAHRRTIGAGTLPNEPDALRAWLADHQSIKPGNLMPRHDELGADTLASLAEFLEAQQ